MDKMCTTTSIIILVLLIVLSPLFFGSVQPVAVAAIELAAVLLGLLWLFGSLARGKIEYAKTPLNLLVLLWLAFVLFQLLSSTQYFQATKTELLKLLAFGLILFTVTNTIRTKKQVKMIVAAIILTGCAMAVFGIIQNILWNGKLFWFVPLTRGGDPFGPYVNKNHFAGYICMVVPLSIGFFLSCEKKFSLSSSPLVIVGIVVMCGALFYSSSRSGIISLVLALIFMAAFLAKLRSLKLVNGLALVVAALLLSGLAWIKFEPFSERLPYPNNVSWETRLGVWQGTIAIIRDFPVLGTGLGTFAQVFPGYRLEQTRFFFAHTHNDFLELLSDAGIVGFIIIFGFGTIIVIHILRRLGSRRDPWIINLTAGCLTSLFSIFIFSFSDFNLHIPANMLLISIIAGLTITIVNQRSRSKSASTFATQKVFQTGPKFKAILYPFGVISAILLSALIVKPVLADQSFQKALKAEKLDRKIAGVQKSIRLEPRDARYHHQLGLFYGMEQKNWALALGSFREAARLNPNNSRYRRGLALSYLHLGMNLPAVTLLEQAVKLDPQNPYRHRDLARVYLKQAQQYSPRKYIEKAMLEYKQAISLDVSFITEAVDTLSALVADFDELKTVVPNTPEARLEFGIYLKAKNNQAQSEREIGLAIFDWYSELENAPEKEAVQIHENLARAYRTLEQYDLALIQYQKALDIAPDNAWLHYRIGTLYEGMDDNDKAVAFFRKALALDRNHSWAGYNLARIYESQGKQIQAHGMWRVILRQKNGDKDAKRIARNMLADNL